MTTETTSDISKYLERERALLMTRKIELINAVRQIDRELEAIEAYQRAKGTTLGADEATLSVPEAGQKYFGLSRNSAYIAALKGKIPSVKIGGRRRVPVAALERMFGQAAE